MASITVKILYQQQASKTFKFTVDTTVADALVEIRHKIGMEGNLDHGLFENSSKGKKARWLQPSRTFKFYNISNGSEFEFKKKHRILKVNLPDESQRSVLIDSSLIIRDIIKIIAHKVLIKDSDEYGLQRQNSPNNAWLDMEKTLYEEDVAETEILVFGKILHANDYSIDSSDFMQVYLVYVQSTNDVMAGKFDPLQRNEVAELASTQIQAMVGDFDLEKYKNNIIDISKYLPPVWRKDRKVEKLVMTEHEKLIGMKENQAKLRYVQIVRSLPTYGISQYEVIERQKGKKKGSKLILGITKDKILLLDCETRAFIKEWEMEQLRKWAPTSNTLTLDFGDYEDDYFVFQTEEAESISRIIGAYIDVKIKNQRESMQQSTVDEVGAEAVVQSVSHIIGNVAQSVSQSFVSGYSSAMTDTINAMSNIRNIPTQINVSATPVMGSFMPRSYDAQVTDIKTTLEAFKILQEEMSLNVEIGSIPKVTPMQWQSQIEKCRESLEQNLAKLTDERTLKNYDLSMINKLCVEVHRDVLGIATASKGFTTMSPENAAVVNAQAIANISNYLLDTINLAHEQGAVNNEMTKICLSRAMNALSNIKTSYEVSKNSKSHLDLGSQAVMNEAAQAVSLYIQSSINLMSTKLGKVQDAKQREVLQRNILQMKMLDGSEISVIKSLIPVAYDDAMCDLLLQNFKSVNSGFATMVGEISSTTNDQDLVAELTELMQTFEDSYKRVENIKQYRGRKFAQSRINLSSNASDLTMSLNGVTSNVDNIGLLIKNAKEAVQTANLMLSNVSAISPLFEGEVKRSLLMCAQQMSVQLQNLMESVRTLSRNPDDVQCKSQVLECCAAIEYKQKTILKISSLKASQLDLHDQLLSLSASVASAQSIILASMHRDIKDSAQLRQAEQVNKILREVDSEITNLMKALNAATLQKDDVLAVEKIVHTSRIAISKYRTALSIIEILENAITSPAVKAQLKGKVERALGELSTLEQSVNLIGAVGDIVEVDTLISRLDAVVSEAQKLTQQDNVHAPQIAEPERRIMQNLATEQFMQSKSAMESQIFKLYNALKTGDRVTSLMSQIVDSSSQLVGSVGKMMSSIDDKKTNQLLSNSVNNMLSSVSQLMEYSRMTKDNLNDPKYVSMLNETLKSVRSSLTSLYMSSRGVDLNQIDEAANLIVENRKSVTHESSADVNYNQSIKDLMSLSKSFMYAVEQISSPTIISPESSIIACKNVVPIHGQLCSLLSKILSNNNDPVIISQLEKNNAALSNHLCELLATAKRSIADDKDNGVQLNQIQESIRSCIQNIIHQIETSNEKFQDAELLIMSNIDKLDSPGEDRALLHVLEEFAVLPQSLINSMQTINTAVYLSNSNLATHCWDCSQIFQSMVNNVRSVNNLYSRVNMSGPKLLEEYLNMFKSTYETLKLKTDFTNSIEASKRLAHPANQILAMSRDVSSQLSKKDPGKKKIVERVKLMAFNAQELMKIANNGTSLQNSGGEYLSEHNVFNQTLEEFARSVFETSELLAPYVQDYVNSDVLEPELLLQIRNTCRVLGVRLVNLVQVVNSSASDSTKPASQQATNLSSVCAEVSGLLGNFTAAVTMLNPGVKGLNTLMKEVKLYTSQIEASSIKVMSGKRLELTEQQQGQYSELKDRMAQATKSLAESMNSVSQLYAKSNAQALSRAVQGMVKSFLSFKDTSIEFLNAAPTIEIQRDFIMRNKELIESLNQFVDTASSQILAGESAQASSSLNSAPVSNALSHLLNIVQSENALLEDIDNTIEVVKTLVQQSLLETAAQSSGGDAQMMNYSDYFKILESQMTRNLTDQVLMISMQEGTTSHSVLPYLQVRELLPKWLGALQGCVDTITENDSVKNDITKGIKNFVDAVVDMLQKSKLSISNPSNKTLVEQQKSSATAVFDMINRLVMTAKRGDMNEVMFTRSIDMVNGSISKMNTLSDYARPQLSNIDYTIGTARSYHKQIESDSLEVEELIVSLRQAIAANSGKLGSLSFSIADKFSQIIEYTSQTIPIISDASLQQELMSESKMLGMRLYQYLLAAKMASINRNDPLVAKSFENSEQVLIDSLRSYTNTVGKGTHQVSQVERAITENISKIRNIKGGTTAKVTADVSSVAMEIKNLVSSMSNFVISQNQSEFVHNSSATANLVEKFMLTFNGVIDTSPDEETKKRLMDLSGSFVDSVEKLFTIIKDRSPNSQNNEEIEEAASNSTNILTDMIESFKKLPGGENIDKDVNFESFEALAISELEKCASIIESAAQNLKVARTKQAVSVSSMSEEDVAMSESIFVAVQAITNATKILVDAATVVQNERVKAGISVLPSSEKYHRGPTWSNGLISASKNVSISVEQLVKVASETVMSGKENSEAIIAATKAVSVATTHLVTASRVRSDVTSDNQVNLSRAATSVTAAASKLVSAVNVAVETKQQNEKVNVEGGFIGSTKAKFNQQIKILRLEAEIERERRRLASMNKNSYAS